jgi:phosphohistidine phosphatase
MNLYLLRHGLAVERGTAGVKHDADRPLTPKGKQRLWRIAEALDALELEFDAILTSPCLRALQTAEIVAETFELRKKLGLCDHLAPTGSPRLLLEQIAKLEPRAKNVLLVGHEPYLGKLIALLTSGHTHLALDLKKGGICKLEVDTLRYGPCATLAWMLTPKQLLLMV